MHDPELAPETTEILWDGKTVWANDSSGCCIGRFGIRGVDVHKSGADQLESNSQCLDCIHDLPPDAAWSRFVASMRTHHGVEIPEVARPTFVPRSGS